MFSHTIHENVYDGLCEQAHANKYTHFTLTLPLRNNEDVMSYIYIHFLS